MKKRITALLLCLVMVFSLIPTTVWAASNSTVVLHPSVGNTVTGVKVKVGDKIDGHAITSISGYDITVDLGKYNVNNDTFRLPYAKDIWEGVDNNKVDYISWAGSGSNSRSEGGSALLANGENTAYYYFKGAPVLLTFTLNYDANGGNGAPASQTYKATSQYEKSYTFTISSQTPTREGYNFLGWNTDKNAATASKQPGNTIVVNNNDNPTTLYAVWEEKAPVTPDDPKVGENFNFSKDIVKVICETTDTHNDSYGLKNGYYSVSDKKQLANGNWQCKITVDLDGYFALYNSEHTGHTRDMNHPKATSIMTINPTWYASTGKWSSAESLIDAAEIYVKCEATQPEGPGENDTPNMAELLTVECVTADAKHTPKSAQYDIVDKGTLTQATDTTWTYTVTLNRTTYIDKFNGETKTAHTDKAPNDVITLTWNWKNGKWTKGFDENPVIKCECKTEIEPPTDGPTDDDVKAALGNVTVTVKCINPGTKHTSCAYGVLGGNDGYQLTKNKDGTYNVVLHAAPFVKAYSSGAQTQKQAHELVSAATLTWVLTFDKESGKWVGKPKEAGVDDIIQTAHRVPVHVVIYRNGDTSQAYADIALNSELPGTVIDLTKLKIGDYYQGNVEFYGWYDDGLWNIYKANVANDKAAPAGLTTKTVNGWTNLKCMVYDLDKVVYFQSAEDLAAYQNDHSKTDGLLYTTTVRRGTALPTADAPTATRDGYTFKFWSREGQTADVTGQTVNGWTNLYANWEINTYNIAATLYMNGADSSVQETGKTYPWSHSYGGEYGKPIDYTDMFAALKAKALEVDAANEPYDAEIKLCFPKSDKLFNETIKTYGQDGAFWNPGVKNTAYIWGHATTSYQVIFNTGDGSKVDTQIVKYGDKATEPAEPNRYGYEFKGWFEEGATDAFDFKNGITHKTQLTAQWEKQTYTVKFDSMGGSKVDDQQVKYQDKANKPADPTKSGYTFAGWYTDNKCTKGNEFSFDTKITGDITLYAKWDVKRTGTNPDAKNPYIKDNTKKDDGKKVESGKTFDAGIAMYVGLSILSVTGSAVVIRKRKDF